MGEKEFSMTIPRGGCFLPHSLSPWLSLGDAHTLWGAGNSATEPVSSGDILTPAFPVRESRQPGEGGREERWSGGTAALACHRVLGA